MSKVMVRGMDIPVDKIKPSPYQPRMTFRLDDLIGSIKKDGILVDLLVRKKTDYFELIDGERRLRVAKQLNLNSVPCKIVDVDDETAMGMVYTVNQEREEYSLRENVRYATLLFKLNQNITSIAEKMRRSRSQVRDYLNVGKLPKKYQEYLWANKFGIGHLREVSGLLNGGRASIVLKHLDVVLDRKLTRDEFRKYLRPYLIDVEEKRVDSAKKAAGEIELDVKEPETPEDFEAAAKTLKKKARDLKTPEQRMEENREKVRKSLLSGSGNALSKIENAKSLGIDTSGYEKRLREIESNIDDDPKAALKDSTSLKKTLNNIIKKEEQRLREEEIRRKAAEDERKRIEAKAKAEVEAEREKLEKERKRLEAELEEKLRAEREKLEEERKRLEAERERLKAEARQKLLEDRGLLEEAEKSLKKIRFEELKVIKLEEQLVKRPQINILNELAGDEWLKFTKSWYVFDALLSDLSEERAITSSLTEDHPATYSPTMISDYVRFFTKRDAVVLDPFVGIGSTLVACSRTGRKGIGIDINEQYVDIAMKRIEGDPNQKVIHGDAWDIEKYDLPKLDYCVTSPPYFRMLKKIDVTQKRRIRKGLSTDYGDSVDLPEEVDEYVDALVDLFSKVAKITNEKGHLTVIIQNFRRKGRMIPLAWLFAIAIHERGDWIFKGERLWLQDHKKLHPFGQKYDFVSNIHHHYCLIFRRA